LLLRRGVQTGLNHFGYSQIVAFEVYRLRYDPALVITHSLERHSERRHPTALFVVVMGATTILATSLHAVEAGIWAATYRLLGALPDDKSAMLYSLSAIISYGHAGLFLGDRWQLMGPMEALNGWLLFGLTTAFLFGMFDRVWLLSNRGGRR
jgi:hypothetical protein